MEIKVTYNKVVEVKLVLYPEIHEGSCAGCFFDDKPVEECPKNAEYKLRCSHYTEGPAGIWAECAE